MNYNHPAKHNSTVSIRLMCAIVFLSFSFAFLYFFQAEILGMAQHVLSGGLTHYNRLLGAVLITLVLQLLQLLVYTTTRLRKRNHALTYVPSLLTLGMITDVSSDIDLHFSMGAWWWVFPLVILVWIGVVILCRAIQDVEPEMESTGLFSRAMWINMLIMALMIVGVVAISNTDAVFHYRMRAEACLRNNDFRGALEQGQKSLESDANLQMLRMYALSRTNELGERLFNYPVVAGNEAILPVSGESRFSWYPVDSLYKFLGAKPGAQMTTNRYLELMQQRDSTVNRSIADYQLCALLIDKKLDAFTKALVDYYSDQDTLQMDSLPKHYREALTLYTRLRSKPIVVYHNAVMDEDWRNMQELEAQYADFSERKGKVEEQYRGTYWYYYKYE